MEKKRDVDYLQVFFASRFIKQIQATLPVPIDSKQFIDLSCIMVEEKIAKMSPRQLLAAFDMFDDSEMKSRLMTATIKGLKAYKLDIRLFNSTQLSQLITLVT